MSQKCQSSPENEGWERLPQGPGIYQMRNAFNHQDGREIRIVQAVLLDNGNLIELNAYDRIGEFNGYYGEYKKLRPFDLSKPEDIAPEDLQNSRLTI